MTNSMFKRLFRFKSGVALVLIGLVLFAFAFVMQRGMDDVVQYCAPMTKSEEESDTTAASELLDSWNERRSELGGVAALSVVKYSDSLMTDEKSVEDVKLIFAGEGYFNVHPAYLKEGRLFTDNDYKSGERVIVIDEDAAFKLFGNEPAEDKSLYFYGEEFKVAGVIRSKYAPGEHNAYIAFITYKCADKLRIEGEYALIEAKRSDSGAARSLSALGEELLPGGTFCDVAKETMRGGMAARIVFIVLAVAALITLIGRWTGNTVDMVKGFFEEVKRRYFRSMLPKVIALSLLHLFVYALLIGGCFGVLYLLIEPMFVFTEWIPKVFVDPDDIKSVYSALTRENSVPVLYRTAEYASARFYGALSRWGAITALTGCAVCAVKASLTKWENE